MSAFLVSHKHIAVMVAAMLDYELIKIDETIKTGQLLIRANLKSLTTRYGKNHGFHDSESDKAYIATFGPLHDRTRNHYGNEPIVKACDCFDYQACEFDGYYKTKAHKLTSLLRNAVAIKAAQRSNSYDNAQWGI